MLELFHDHALLCGTVSSVLVFHQLIIMSIGNVGQIIQLASDFLLVGCLKVDDWSTKFRLVVSDSQLVRSVGSELLLNLFRVLVCIGLTHIGEHVSLILLWVIPRVCDITRWKLSLELDIPSQV